MQESRGQGSAQSSEEELAEMGVGGGVVARVGRDRRQCGRMSASELGEQLALMLQSEKSEVLSKTAASALETCRWRGSGVSG